MSSPFRPIVPTDFSARTGDVRRNIWMLARGLRFPYFPCSTPQRDWRAFSGISRTDHGSSETARWKRCPNWTSAIVSSSRDAADIRLQRRTYQYVQEEMIDYGVVAAHARA